MERTPFIFRDSDGNPIDLESLSVEELKDLKVANLGELTSIKQQITSAAANFYTTGVRADSGWFHRANKARGIKALIDQKIAIELARRREVQKQENLAKHDSNRTKFLEAFIETAQEMLPSNLFNAIVKAAMERGNSEP